MFKINFKSWNFKADEKDDLNLGIKKLSLVQDKNLPKKIDKEKIKSIFREYDLRGKKDLFNEDAVKGIAYALTVLIYKRKKNNKKIIIGSDNEDYNIKAKEIAKKVFIDAGLEVYDIGIVSSPTIYFAQKYLRCDNICSFTASHNPYGDIGLKTGITGSTFGPYGISVLSKQFFRFEYYKAKNKGKLHKVNKKQIFKAYYEMLKAKPIKPPKNVYLMINTLNATAGEVSKYIFEKFGINLITVNYELKPSKPKDPPKNPEIDTVKRATQKELLKVVKNLNKKKINTKNIFALAFDRDGDRMVPIGQKAIASADELAILAFRQKVINLNRKKKQKKVMVADIKSSMSLYDEPLFKKESLEVYPWFTGHSYIKQYIRFLKTQDFNVIGGAEKSGHLFQEDAYDEPIESALLLLQYLHENNYSLEDALNTLIPYELGPSTKVYLDKDKLQGSLSLKERKYEIIKEIINNFKSFYKGQKIVDGKYKIIKIVTLGLNLRVFFKDLKNRHIEGNFVLRPSSNEEIFTINIEIKKEFRYTEYIKEIIDIENFLAFEILSVYPEFTSVNKPKAGWTNHLSTLDSQRDYLENYLKAEKIGNNLYKYRTRIIDLNQK
jgi:phosphomannomutase